MKLVQITHDESGTHRIYKCEVCGHVITTDEEILKCPVCCDWAESVVEEMEEEND